MSRYQQQLHGRLQPDERDVVDEVARVVLVVDEDVDDVELDVGVELGVVVNVPFSGTDPAIFL